MKPRERWYSFVIRNTDGRLYEIDSFRDDNEYGARLQAERKYPNHIVRRYTKRS